MERYQKELEQMTVKTQHLAEWCNQDPDKIDPRMLSKRKYKLEDDEYDDKDPDDRSQLTDQLSKLGMFEEKEELEPWIIQEMDQYLSDIWLTGNEDLFPQVFHLIKSENVSVDYQHSETTVSALMIAAGRGFTDIVEQLLTMGADPAIKSSNDWAPIDWAKHFNQEDTVALLEAQMSASEMCGETESYIDNDDSSDLTDIDKQRLFIYQHCWDDDVVDIQLITILLYHIVTTQPEGSILIFLPGYHEIVSLRDMIDGDERFARIRYTLFQLHSSMQSADQKKVFKPSPAGIRKIILATNIAETSITINDVVYVINSGKVKEKTFDSLLKITMLKSNWISKASVAQRRGRAGRVRKGVCYNMFSKVRYHHLLDYAIPELLRCPLQEICLQTKLLAPINQSILEFLTEAPEPPPFMVVRSAISVLKEMDALDMGEEMTELGRHLADLPVEPHLGKMVLYSIVLKCVDPVLTVVCSLSYKDPFLIPNQPSEKRMLSMIKQNFAADTFSDHMTLLRLFQAWQKARSEGWERQFCSRNYISPAVMEMIVGMRAQLLGQLRASGFVRARGGGDIRDLNTNSENWAVVKAALFAGGYPNVIRWDRNSWKFVSKSGEKIKIHISSVLPQKPGGLPSDWLFYEEMTRSNQGQHGGMACIRCCTILSPLTVAMFAGPAKLPADALKDTPETDLEDGVLTSDSENEDPEENKCSTLQLVDWLSFKLDAETADLVLQLRQKWHCLFLRRMRAPAKPWTPMDEAVINAVVNVLTNEEQALGLQQPAGIGQRPRPMSAESIMSGSYNGRGNKYHEDIEDSTKHRFSTSAKKATSTPPKRKDFMSPKMRSNDSSSQNSPSLSHHSSEECSPYHSPQIEHSSTGVRYFIMKCSSQRNIDISVNKGAWATSKTNEQKLNKAFLSGDTVYLIYSIQGSGHFQGYATMSSCIGTDKSTDYNGQGGVFSVDWIKRGNIKFQCTHHLLNPWNEGKRVQVSRDGQEIEPKIGEALISLWDSYPDNDGDREPRWSTGNTGHGSDTWTNRQQMFVTDPSGDGYHDNRSFTYQNQQQYGPQYNQQERYYTQQTYNPHYQSWGNQGSQRFQYNQRSRQGHYSGFGNYGYQGHEQGHQYVESGSQYHRDSPVMILQRDQRQSAFPKHKK
ncbi:3'-5' RNA helicase ythdc2 [Mactra antiquata]